MTQEQIEQTIDAIRKGGAEALRSKESARQSLIDAGIIQDKKKKKGTPPKRSTH